jgi:hypothetical protein
VKPRARLTSSRARLRARCKNVDVYWERHIMILRRQTLLAYLPSSRGSPGVRAERMK